MYLINKPLRCTECNRKTLVTFIPQWTSHEWIYRSCSADYSRSYHFQKSHHYFFDWKDIRCKACQNDMKMHRYCDNASSGFWKHGVIAMFTLSCTFRFYFLKCTILFLNWFISQVTNWTKVTRILSSKDPLWSLRAFSILSRLYRFINSATNLIGWIIMYAFCSWKQCYQNIIHVNIHWL